MYQGVTRTVLMVTGICDNRGREQLADALEGVPGVVQVDVNLFRAHAVVLHEPLCAPADLVRAVVEAGYQAVMGAG